MERVIYSIRHAREMQKMGEVWPSVVLSAAIPLIAGKEKGLLANNLYKFYREVDDIVDEGEQSREEKLSLVNHLIGIFTNGREENKNETPFPVCNLERVKKIVEHPYFNSNLAKYNQWALIGMKREVQFDVSPFEIPTFINIEDLRTRAVFPYVMMATELLSGRSIDFGINETTRNLINLSRAIAKGGDIRDRNEDIERGRFRFSKQELCIINEKRNFIKEGLRYGFKCSRKMDGLNLIERVGYSSAAIARNFLLYLQMELND